VERRWKVELYRIQIDELPVIECDSYELVYAKDGRVYTLDGCVKLATEPIDVEDTWLSQKIISET